MTPAGEAPAASPQRAARPPAAPLRIGIDLSVQGLDVPTGVERAQASLLAGLLSEQGPEGLQLVLVTCGPRSDAPLLRQAAWAEHPAVRWVETERRPVWWWREVAFAQALRAHAVDLVHSPVAAVPLSLSIPRVATIHEVPWAAGEDNVGGDSRLAHRLRLRLAVSRCARLVCPSQRTARALVSVHPHAQPRVCVVPHGLDPSFETAARASARELPRVVRARHEAGGRLLLAVGRLRAKKNLGLLLDALMQPALADAFAVLVGPAGDASDELRRHPALAASRALLTGPVDEAELIALYDHAHAVVFPSLLEGFGLPVLEAMARGVPVLASHQGAVSEAAGEAVLRFDGCDQEDFVRALGTLDQGTRRARLVDAGRVQVQQRSASGMAHALADIWGAVAADHPLCGRGR